jgi:hypothetical protein
MTKLSPVIPSGLCHFEAKPRNLLPGVVKISPHFVRRNDKKAGRSFEMTTSIICHFERPLSFRGEAEKSCLSGVEDFSSLRSSK